ncbi:MAG: hypothetical protein P0Y62_05360 [Candidatus Chryseobacterium colombiense]|nr:hypothetical protein [Chryseobacterium sp.]WEK70984.1 MAG: hypothetical protein P0Y62_05360 [Chryseobacterium sp.]
MKKIILLTVLNFLSISLVKGQESDKYKLNIIPPSTTVNNLMKFEEVPVSNYTGIPDITIPIKSLSTGLSNVSLNLQLKYHVNNAKSESKAGEAGLGWSLLAGGTISRTVMDSPDEKIISYSLGSANKKIGIYFDENTNVSNYKNYFGSMIENPNSAMYTEKSIFEAHYKNRYDTKYDLYQYNFLNYTGRFIIKKINGQLQAVKLDKNNLKITVNAPADFAPVSFEITDDFGNIFVFDVLETSKSLSVNNVSGVESYTNTGYSEMNYLYNSAFHLSKIKNSNNDVKVNLIYDAEPSTIVSSENTTSNNTIYYSADNIFRQIIAQNAGYLPKITETSTNTTIANTKKLKEINVVGQGSVLFDYEYGREDTNYENSLSQLSKLKSITVRSTDGQYDEKFNFTYAYKNLGVYKRLFLTSIEKQNKSNGTYIHDQDYALEYYGLPGISLPLVAEDDSFYKCSKEYPYGCSHIELLKSITYPTKGKSEFIYETGTYSYVPKDTSSGMADGADALSNYDENPLNWDDANTMVVFSKFSEEKKLAFTLTESTSVKIQLETAAINSYGFIFRIHRKEGGVYSHVAGIDTSILSTSDPIPTVYENTFPAGEYYLELNNQQIGIGNPTFNTSFNLFYKIRNTNNLKYVFDYRNVRIKNINYYTDQSGTPSRTISFGYNDPANVKKSTGALVFPRPVYRYTYPYRATLEYVCSSDLNYPCKEIFNADIIYNSSRNFLPVQKTKGGDIGYQFVSVSETGRGKTLYQYTSPIDKPNLYTPTLIPPFNSVPNYDYLRGNLINKKVYGENNALLSEDRFSYQYNDYEVSTGAAVSLKENMVQGYYLHGGKYETYEAYSIATGQNAFSFMNIGFEKEYSGTANLVEEQSIMYYNQNAVTQNVFNQYNTRDYLIKKTQTHSDGSLNETSYKYAHEKGNTRLINANMIAIPLEIESKNNNRIVGKTETLYNDPSHFFPTSVLSLDPQASVMNTEITYDQYDNKGNLQQYTTKNGISTTIIWGYNTTQPIAKIEGAKLSDISQSLIDTIVSASNNDAAAALNNDETALLAALNTFSTDASLSRYQITTYTYDPLVGVRSITPPSGIREVYIYDFANRLKEVREQNQTGKLLKEYQYHYKN